jgi:hypothetical protein
MFFDFCAPANQKLEFVKGGIFRNFQDQNKSPIEGQNPMNGKLKKYLLGIFRNSNP